MPKYTNVYISLVTAAGLAAMARHCAFLDPPWPHDLFRFCTYLLLSLLAAALKLRPPGITATISIGFVLVLLGIPELTLPEAILNGMRRLAVQCLWRPKSRPALVLVFFSVSAVAISLVLGYECSHFVRAQFHAAAVSIVLAVATCLYFVANSLLVSGVLLLVMVRSEPLRVIWQQCYLCAFPHYPLEAR